MAYNKHTWETNELITDILLNNIEDGIAAATNTADNAAPKTLTINGKALSANITLDATDVGAVPTTRKVNNKALSADITLSAADVGAVAKTGDTMTGTLTVEGALIHLQKKSPEMDVQVNPSADLYNYGLYMVDKGNKPIGQVDTVQVTDGNTALRLIIYNYDTAGNRTTMDGFYMLGTRDGKVDYHVANPENFRAALGLGKSSGALSIANGGTSATTVEGARTTLDVYSKSEVDALVTGGATPSGDYLPISGGTLSGNLYLNFTNAYLRVGSTDGSAGVSIYHSSEGGNINIKSPNGTTWEMDAYSNTFFRLYYNTGAPSWLFMNDGSFKIQGVQTPYIALQSNIVDITSSTNNITGNALNPALTWLDKNGTATCSLTNVLSADGSNAFYIYIQNRDGSNNPSGLRGIKYTLSNANVGSWVISDPAAFRSALSIGSVTDSNVWLVNTSRTANTVLAAPNGSAGSASFRALVADDIPSLSASKITSGTMTGPITITGSLGAGCYVKATGVNLTSATNGVTSTTQPGFVIQDNTTKNIATFKGYVESNGNTGYRIGAYQFDTSGNQVSQAVIGVSIAKNGTQTWTLPIPFIQAVRSEFTGSSTWTNAYSKAKALIKVVFKITYSNNVHVLVIDVPKQVVTTTGQFFFSSSCLHDGKQLFAQGMYTTDGAQWENVFLGSDVQTYSSKNYYYI